MIAPKTVAAFAFHHAGPVALIRRANRKSLRILMYHRFPTEDADQFRRQCEHIIHFYRPISLTHAARHFRDNIALPENAVVVTIDDGYRDFYLHGYPALKSFGIPATMFLTTGVIDGLTWFWWDKLNFALDHTPLQSISIAGERDVPLLTPNQRQAALDRIAEAMTKLPNQDRLITIDSLPDLFKVKIPLAPPEKFAPLNWDEIREMARNGVEFGAHTVTHPILSRVESVQELRSEMEISRDRIAAELGMPIRHFCYPSGRPEDLDGRVKQLAESAGFETAVTTHHGFNKPGADLLLMSRIGADPHYGHYYFARQLAGFRVGS